MDVKHLYFLNATIVFKFLFLGRIINYKAQIIRMGLIKTILFILLFYYGFKFLAKIIAPLLLVKVANKMKEKGTNQYSGQQSKSTIKEGETVIDKAPVKNTNSKNTVGEYVDFEEID